MILFDEPTLPPSLCMGLSCDSELAGCLRIHHVVVFLWDWRWSVGLLVCCDDVGLACGGCAGGALRLRAARNMLEACGDVACHTIQKMCANARDV